LQDTVLHTVYAFPDLTVFKPQDSSITAGSQPKARWAMNGINIAGDFLSDLLPQHTQ